MSTRRGAARGALLVMAGSAPGAADSMKTKRSAVEVQPLTVTVTSISVRPDAPMPKTMEWVPLPEVMAPLSMVQWNAAPACAGARGGGPCAWAGAGRGGGGGGPCPEGVAPLAVVAWPAAPACAGTLAVRPFALAGAEPGAVMAA